MTGTRRVQVNLNFIGGPRAMRVSEVQTVNVRGKLSLSRLSSARARSFLSENVCCSCRPLFSSGLQVAEAPAFPPPLQHVFAFFETPKNHTLSIKKPIPADNTTSSPLIVAGRDDPKTQIPQHKRITTIISPKNYGCKLFVWNEKCVTQHSRLFIAIYS